MLTGTPVRSHSSNKGYSLRSAAPENPGAIDGSIDTPLKHGSAMHRRTSARMSCIGAATSMPTHATNRPGKRAIHSAISSFDAEPRLPPDYRPMITPSPIPASSISAIRSPAARLSADAGRG